jgi:hypothetical protein
VLALKRGDVVGQALGLEPGSEPADVSAVLGSGVLGPSVCLELDEEAGEGVGDEHGGLGPGLGRRWGDGRHRRSQALQMQVVDPLDPPIRSGRASAPNLLEESIRFDQGVACMGR